MYAQSIDEILAGAAIPRASVWDGCVRVVFTRDCDDRPVVYNEEGACDGAGG